MQRTTLIESENKQTEQPQNKQTTPHLSGHQTYFSSLLGKFFRTLNNRFSLYPASSHIPRGKDFYSTPDLQDNSKWSEKLLSLKCPKLLSWAVTSLCPRHSSFWSHLRTAPACPCHHSTRRLRVRLGSVNQNTTLTSPSPMNNNSGRLNWF